MLCLKQSRLTSVRVPSPSIIHGGNQFFRSLGKTSVSWAAMRLPYCVLDAHVKISPSFAYCRHLVLVGMMHILTLMVTILVPVWMDLRAWFFARVYRFYYGFWNSTLTVNTLLRMLNFQIWWTTGSRFARHSVNLLLWMQPTTRLHTATVLIGLIWIFQKTFSHLLRILIPCKTLTLAWIPAECLILIKHGARLTSAPLANHGEGPFRIPSPIHPSPF